MATRLQVVIDCGDPARLAAFWADAIHYKMQDPPDGYESWEAWLREHDIPRERWNDASAIVDPDGAGPRIFFQHVPETKTVKNRMHLDLNQATHGTPLDERRRLVDHEVERLQHLGARELGRREERGEYFVTMADPEGNEFCVQ
ncbi:MAG: VOC family protein [Chloroflexota bacterium]